MGGSRDASHAGGSERRTRRHAGLEAMGLKVREEPLRCRAVDRNVLQLAQWPTAANCDELTLADASPYATSYSRQGERAPGKNATRGESLGLTRKPGTMWPRGEDSMARRRLP